MQSKQELITEESGSEATDKIIISSLARLDGIALGVSLGAVFGMAIFLATNILVWKGGDVIGPNLALLAQYFVGYEVSFAGSLVGSIYGAIVGFVLGWLIAFLRNFVVNVYIQVLKVKGSMSAVNDYIDNP
jgi:hypothetical protein